MKKTPKHIRKSSEIIIEMAEHILKPVEEHDHDAMSVALLFAQLAWNTEVENLREHDLSPYFQALIEIEISTPDLWSYFISPDKDEMIRKLRIYKKTHFPFERRLLLMASISPEGNVQVTWSN